MRERHICAKFGMDASSDFRFIRGTNHGMGKVFIYIGGVGAPQPILLTQGNTQNIVMRVEAPVRVILCPIFETMKAQIRSLTIPFLRSRTG